MADTAPAKSPAKKKATKSKKPSSHPRYSEMIKKAISTLKERGGSSRQAIQKYILANYKVDATNCKNHLRMALKAGVKNKTLKQSKGTGASGSFRLGDKAERKPKAKKVKKAKKPKAAGTKKVRKTKAAGAKKSPKKVRKPKAAKKSPKKVAKPKAVKKSPAKKAAKSKKAKSPKKKAAKK